MKSQWIEYYSGVIKVKVSGRGVERLINRLMRDGVKVWNVKRQGTEAITFYMKYKDVNKLRAAVRTSGCKVRFLEKVGGPFLIRRLRTNSGFFTGGALFLAVLMFLSNMVWGIEIKGASPATEYQIRKHLDDMGVKKGKLQFFIGSPEAVQRELTNAIQALTWVGVELKGTTYHFQVVEKNEPEKVEYYSPRHLVAAKKAIIVDMFIEKGEPVVNVNDHVKPGQLLVSGIIPKDDGEETVPAQGEVLGKTWYKTVVELPLTSSFQVFNGNEKKKYYVKIGGFSIPVWGFGKNEYKEFEKETNETALRFLVWELPIAFVDSTFREREKATRIYSTDEAIKKAKEMARIDIKSSLHEDAIIKGEKVLHQSIENDKVNLITHFEIIENIAEGQPIIQGDEE